MIADGLHSCIDGLTSLAVLIAVAGTLVALPIIDPLLGMLIGVTILFITKDAAVRIWYRLMDAVNPTLVDQIEHYASEVIGVETVEKLRVRWVGHQLFAKLTITVAAKLSIAEGTIVADAVVNTLQQAVPHLVEVTIQIHPRSKSVEQLLSEIPDSLSALHILPPRYQLNCSVSAAPMGAAGLIYPTDRKVAWDEISQGFCDLALAGGLDTPGNTPLTGQA